MTDIAAPNRTAGVTVLPLTARAMWLKIRLLLRARLLVP
jgi:hypothetical protein